MHAGNSPDPIVIHKHKKHARHFSEDSSVTSKIMIAITNITYKLLLF